MTDHNPSPWLRQFPLGPQSYVLLWGKALPAMSTSNQMQSEGDRSLGHWAHSETYGWVSHLFMRSGVCLPLSRDCHLNSVSFGMGSKQLLMCRASFWRRENDQMGREHPQGHLGLRLDSVILMGPFRLSMFYDQWIERRSGLFMGMEKNWHWAVLSKG